MVGKSLHAFLSVFAISSGSRIPKRTLQKKITMSIDFLQQLNQRGSDIRANQHDCSLRRELRFGKIGNHI
jgi:hypothetical protein